MATSFETQHTDDLQSQDLTLPSTKHATLSRLRAPMLRKMNAYTNIMCGSPADFITLCPRITRSFDDRPRKPAEGPFTDLLEAAMTRDAKHSIARFDGYVIPKTTPVVTRLLYAREYTKAAWYEQEARISGVDRNVEALALTTELLNTIDSDSALNVSRLTGAPVDVVLTPRDYPRDASESRLPLITLVTDLFGDQTIRFLNVDQFRDHLVAQGKRATRKGMTFACTRLEMWLSNTVPGGAWKHDDQWTTAFPGDADAMLMGVNPTTGDQDPICVFEYKSDVAGYPIEQESRNKYSNDGTRFNVLDDLCNVLNVPLALVFWSTQHRNAKVVFRNAKTGTEETPSIVYAQTYEEAASKIGAIVMARMGVAPAPVAPAPVATSPTSQAPRFKLFHATATPTVVRKPQAFVHAPANDRAASNVSAFPRGAGGSAMFKRLAHNAQQSA